MAFETSLSESIKAVDTGLGHKIDAVDTKVVAFETSLSESIKAGATTVRALDIKIDAFDTKSDGQAKITRAYIAVVGLLVGAAAVFAEADWTNVVGFFR